MRRIIFPIMLVLLLPGISFGGVITVCGASKGYSYFFKNPLVGKPDLSEDKAKWEEDGISNGQIVLVLEGNGKELNLYFKDTLSMRSPKEHGGRVHLLYADQGQNTLLVLVEFPGTGVIEHYLFKLDESGDGRVAWGSVKGVGPVPKSSLFVANCSKDNQP